MTHCFILNGRKYSFGKCHEFGVFAAHDKMCTWCFLMSLYRYIMFITAGTSTYLAKRQSFSRETRRLQHCASDYERINAAYFVDILMFTCYCKWSSCNKGRQLNSENVHNLVLSAWSYHYMFSSKKERQLSPE